MGQMLKGINAQVIEDPSMASNLEVFFGEEEAKHETLAEKKDSEPTPSARKNKRKETTQAQDSDVQPDPLVESPPPPPTKMKRGCRGLQCCGEGKEVSKEDKEKTKGVEEENSVPLYEEIPTEVIAEKAEKSSAIPSAEVDKDITSEELAIVSSPFKPMIVAISSSTTTSFADPYSAKFEAMDLGAQLLKLEKLGKTPSKAKSKAVDEAMDRIRI
ncbi:unnamed protein product [Prunus armeniaca]